MNKSAAVGNKHDNTRIQNIRILARRKIRGNELFKERARNGDFMEH